MQINSALVCVFVLRYRPQYWPYRLEMFRMDSVGSQSWLSGFDCYLMQIPVLFGSLGSNGIIRLERLVAAAVWRENQVLTLFCRTLYQLLSFYVFVFWALYPHFLVYWLLNFWYSYVALVPKFVNWRYLEGWFLFETCLKSTNSH